MSRFLIARLDNAGDVVLSGPAVRAAAARGGVTVLCGPAGEPAARLLPGVSEVLVWDAPWSGFDPPPVDRVAVRRLVASLASRRFDAAAVLTSFHQSPLPLALLLRMAGVQRIAAVGVDYPGSLLDHRLPYREDLHEVEQNLEVAAALGWAAPHDDRLALKVPTGESAMPAPPYMVVHPGASVPARSLPVRLVEEALPALAADGRAVVVTGTADERRDLPLPPRAGVLDLRGETSFRQLASVIDGAEAIVVGNTAAAHVAAATGTPVVSVFAPVVPVHRWRPWKVPSVLLGDQEIPCAGCRSRRCPLPRQECVEGVTAADVTAAVDRLAGATPAWSPA